MYYRKGFRMKYYTFVLVGLFAIACNNPPDQPKQTPTQDSTRVRDSSRAAATSTGTNPDSLPAPFATASVKNYCKVIGWPQEKTPIAPKGFTVTKFADGFY